MRAWLKRKLGDALVLGLTLCTEERQLFYGPRTARAWKARTSLLRPTCRAWSPVQRCCRLAWRRWWRTGHPTGLTKLPCRARSGARTDPLSLSHALLCARETRHWKRRALSARTGARGPRILVSPLLLQVSDKMRLPIATEKWIKILKTNRKIES